MWKIGGKREEGVSNKLRRKAKSLEPLGYSKKELAYIENLSKQNRMSEDVIAESYLNVRLITYQILHDKFGFGKKRIARVENEINNYLSEAAREEMSAIALIHLLKEKYDIDVPKEAGKIPFREQFYLLTWEVKPADMRQHGKWINGSMINFFALLGICLKTQFKFSKNQIEKAYFHIRDYINTLSRPKQFDLTIDQIAESVKEECGFIDERFVKKEG